MGRVRIGGISIVGVAGLATLLGTGPLAAQEPVHLPAAGMQLTEAGAVRIDDTRIISMSPDGLSLVAARPAIDYQRGELCVYDAGTLVQRTCADLSGLDAGLRLSDVTWSPDSRWLAFSERALELFVDGDLWLMDSSTGELTNLLDDGFAGRLPILTSSPPPGTITIPVNPAFSPDSTTLAFSRTFLVDGKPAGNDIAIVPIEGGEPRSIAQVSEATPGVAYYGMRWSPDGSRLYVSVHYQQADDERNGIWVVEADGSGQRQLIGRYQPGYGPAVLQVAADGEHLLVYDPALLAVGQPEPPVFATVDTTDGSAVALRPLDPDAPGYASIWWAAFSPDGGALVTLQRPLEEAVIALRDVGGTVERPLGLQADDGPVRVGPIDGGIAPTWSPDGRLFLTGDGDLESGLVLTIEGSAIES